MSSDSDDGMSKSCNVRAQPRHLPNRGSLSQKAYGNALATKHMYKHIVDLLKIIVLVAFLAPCSSPAYVQFRKLDFRDKSENIYWLYINFETSDVYPSIDLSMPTTILFSSEGGSASDMERFLKPLVYQVSHQAKNSLVKTRIVFLNECYSACLNVLATISQLSAAGLVELIISTDVRYGLYLGFHGATLTYEKPKISYYSESLTGAFIRELQDQGISTDWLRDNRYLFEVNKSDPSETIFIKYSDPILNGSGFFKDARFIPIGLKDGLITKHQRQQLQR